ncbi:MAG: hypothetical protein Q4A09_04485 [Capnocytophaga felis]|nr:hypothetical protein [Capnocytophaga felis]
MNFNIKNLLKLLNFRIFALQIDTKTQRNATQRLSCALIRSTLARVYTFSAYIQHSVTNFLQQNINLLCKTQSKQTGYGHFARNRFFVFCANLKK